MINSNSKRDGGREGGGREGEREGEEGGRRRREGEGEREGGEGGPGWEARGPVHMVRFIRLKMLDYCWSSGIHNNICT